MAEYLPRFQRIIVNYSFFVSNSIFEYLTVLTYGVTTLKARLHRRFLSQQLDAIFVALKLQLQNRTRKPGAIFTAIRRRDIAGVSNMCET